MRKNKLKRFAAMTLAGMMVLSGTACKGSTPTAGSTGVGETGAAGNSQSQKDGSAAGLPEISFMTTSFHGTDLKNDGSDKVIQMYEEHTGIRVNWRWENDDTYNEKLGLTLMDKDNMPMVLTAKDGVMNSNVVDAAKKGAFWDLTPYLADKEAYPNLSQANENVIKALTIDGQIIGIYRGRAIGRYGFSYRKDWAEAVGITKDPQTVEEVYDMLYKFTYNDPDGNGKDDTYGLELTKYTGPIDIIQTWFGTGNEWVEKDGKLVPVHQTEEFKEAIAWIRKLYQDGLIRKDWATVDSGTFGDACKKGEAGAFIDVMDGAKRIWNYFDMNGIMSVTDPSQHAAMTLVGPVNNKTLATSGFNGYYLITKAGAKTEEDVKNCLTFLDKMCDDEMMVLADWGLEGITFDLNDKGNVVLKKEMEAQYTPSAGLNQSLCYIPNISPVSIQLEKDAPTLAQDTAYAKNEPLAVFNPALGYLANSPSNSEVGRDIEQIIDDARTQYICGQIDEAGFEKAAQQWLDRGGDLVMKEVNQLYQADLAK